MRVDLGGTGREVSRVDQPRGRHLEEIRIGEILGAVGENAFLDFGEKVDVLRGVQRNVFELRE